MGVYLSHGRRLEAVASAGGTLLREISALPSGPSFPHSRRKPLIVIDVLGLEWTTTTTTTTDRPTDTAPPCPPFVSPGPSSDVVVFRSPAVVERERLRSSLTLVERAALMQPARAPGGLLNFVFYVCGESGERMVGERNGKGSRSKCLPSFYDRVMR